MKPCGLGLGLLCLARPSLGCIGMLRARTIELALHSRLQRNRLLFRLSLRLLQLLLELQHTSCVATLHRLLVALRLLKPHLGLVQPRLQLLRSDPLLLRRLTDLSRRLCRHRKLTSQRSDLALSPRLIQRVQSELTLHTLVECGSLLLRCSLCLSLLLLQILHVSCVVAHGNLLLALRLLKPRLQLLRSDPLLLRRRTNLRR
jgi:hypothetical protein